MPRIILHHTVKNFPYTPAGIKKAKDYAKKHGGLLKVDKSAEQKMSKGKEHVSTDNPKRNSILHLMP